MNDNPNDAYKLNSADINNYNNLTSANGKSININKRSTLPNPKIFSDNQNHFDYKNRKSDASKNIFRQSYDGFGSDNLNRDNIMINPSDLEINIKKVNDNQKEKETPEIKNSNPPKKKGFFNKLFNIFKSPDSKKDSNSSEENKKTPERTQS